MNQMFFLSFINVTICECPLPVRSRLISIIVVFLVFFASVSELAHMTNL